MEGRYHRIENTLAHINTGGADTLRASHMRGNAVSKSAENLAISPSPHEERSIE
jgi:hypothetical protein